MTSQLSKKTITSYDLLKFAAVIIMVIDHAGTYFYPDELWWRAIGRIGFPVWFFLVGYSRGRGIPEKLLAGACILTVFNIAVGQPVFPLNALFTIILIRLGIDHVMRFALKDTERLILLSAVLFVLIIPSFIVTEYGTQALITAMFGWLVRHRENLDNKRLPFWFMLFALASFIAVQQYLFHFTPAQFIFVVLGTAAFRMCLYHFRAKDYPALTAALPMPAAALIRFCGHRTLEIYVVHLALFKLLALHLGMKGFELLSLRWY